MRVNQLVGKISLFILASIFVILPLTVRAAGLPTPTIKGEVRGDTIKNLAIVVTWKNDGLNEYGYKIEKEGVKGKEIAAIYNPVEVGDADEGSGGFYFDSALVPNDTYTYYVTTFDRAGKESEPAKITLVASVCQPDFQTFTGESKDTGVALVWNSVCGAVEYKLYRDNNLITTTTETSFTDTKATQGEHEYKIEAYDTKTTAWSPILSRAKADKTVEKTIKVRVTKPPVGGKSTCINPVNTEFGWVCDIGDFVNKFLPFLIGILGGLALLMMIIAGYIYMTSQGDQTRVGLAKEIIIGVISGILLLFLIGVFMKQMGVL